jgi:NAD(P) transhydrogenase subunit alpha
MSIKAQISVLKETVTGEARVALSPETAKKFKGLGFDVVVQSGAGDLSSFSDDAYKDAGAKVAKTAKDAVKGADIILKLRTPSDDEIKTYPKGAKLVCLMEPHKNETAIKALAKQGVTSFAMEYVPRITRAQSMDVLSSQANISGYKAVLDATAEFGRAFPLMMTAAGTIPPAKVFVMGAGVAGLQAIATAKRLGAVVSATDVRMAAKEQVESLGGKFVMVEDEETKAAETAGGYAREMSKAYQKKQAALIAETIAKQDVVITTALIPGRSAPVLVTKDMVKTMKPGSVIVDMATSQGGNCELSKVDKVVEVGGVKIIGYSNIPSRIAEDSSSLYARNVFNFVGLLLSEDKSKLVVNMDDEIIKASLLTDGGKVVHETLKPTKKSAKAAPKKKKTPAKAASKKKAPAKKEAKKS